MCYHDIVGMSARDQELVDSVRQARNPDSYIKYDSDIYEVNLTDFIDQLDAEDLAAIEGAVSRQEVVCVAGFDSHASVICAQCYTDGAVKSADHAKLCSDVSQELASRLYAKIGN